MIRRLAAIAVLLAWPLLAGPLALWNALGEIADVVLGPRKR